MIKMRAKKILFAVQDPGGCDALIPVIRRFSKTRGFALECVASGKSRGLLSKEGIPYVDAEGFSEAEVRRTISAFSPGVIAAGTSFGLSVDKLAVKTGRSLGVKTVGIVDYWSNYWKRFEDPSGKHVLPDKICVIDAIMKKEMIKEGFPKSILHVTGNPKFDSLGKTKKRAGERPTKRPSKSVLFISQPFTELKDENLGIGYTEMDAISGIIWAVEKINQESRAGLHIIIKPHPKEDPKKFDAVIKANPGVGITVDSVSGLSEAIDKSAFIIGMSSMALFEAVMGGRQVLSYQPGVKKDLSILGKLGISKTITTKDSLYKSIRLSVLGLGAPGLNPKLVRLYTMNNSTGKVISLINSQSATQKQAKRTYGKG